MQPKAFTSRDDLIGYLRRQRRLFSTKEAAMVLGKHQETIYTMIQEHRLVAVLDGSRWKIDPAALADWIEERTGVFVAPEKKAKRLAGCQAKTEPAVDPDGDAANGVRGGSIETVARGGSLPEQYNATVVEDDGAIGNSRTNHVPQKRDFSDSGDHGHSVSPQITEGRLITPFMPYITRVQNHLANQ